MPRTYLSLFTLVFALAIGVANAAQWQARSWTTDDALPQSSVHAILQSRDGYLWFTTLGGLVRYDGLNFKVFERATTPGIDSNRFTTLFEDRQGSLWAGTDDGVITVLRNGAARSYHAGRAASSILAIAEAGGSVWVLADDGFFVFDGSRFVPRNQTFRTPFGYGYHQGFAYATPSTVELIRPDSRSSVAADHPSNVYTDQRGIVWIEEQDGAVRELNGDRRRIDAKIGDVSAMLAASDDSIWLAVRDKGVAHIEGNAVTWVGKADGLCSTRIVRLFEDREGSVWAGSEDNGISCLRPRIATVWDRIPSANIYPIVAARNGGLLVGTWAAGLYRFDGDNFQHVGNSSGPVMSVLEDPDGSVWWSVYAGGVVNSRNEKRFFTTADGLPSAIVPVLYRDRSGRMWAGTFGGLAVLDGNRFVPVPTSRDAAWREIHVVAEDRDGSLLIGTRAGIGRLRNGRFEAIADATNGMASGNVRAIHVDDDGTLWVGTYDGGISRIRNGKVVSITSREGLYDNGAFCILQDQSFFWITSNRGIYRVERAELNAVADGSLHTLSALALTRRDGLKSAECNGGVQSAGCKTADGRMWFPTQAGVVMVDPRLLRSSAAPPQVQLVKAAVGGREIATTAPIRVPYGGERIDVEFASLTFVDSERTRYRYMLRGLDHTWTQTVGNRSVSYTGLRPGRYEFLVSAANKAGSWNARPATLEIVVLRPFWQTWWFVLATGAVILAAMGLVFLLRMRALERQRAAQAEFSRRLLAQQEDERRRVASELHDSLGQNLLVIKNRALLAAQGDESQISEISDTASAAIDEVRRIAYNLRPAELDHLGVKKAIESLMRRAGTTSNILFSAQLDAIDGLLSKEAEVNLFRIVQEWTANVVRHSNATAAVVNIAYEAPRLTIRMRDDGVGLRETQPNGRVGMGIQSISERARMLGGTCEIVSRRGEGTTMTILIDMGSRH